MRPYFCQEIVQLENIDQQILRIYKDLDNFAKFLAAKDDDKIDWECLVIITVVVTSCIHSLHLTDSKLPVLAVLVWLAKQLAPITELALKSLWLNCHLTEGTKSVTIPGVRWMVMWTQRLWTLPGVIWLVFEHPHYHPSDARYHGNSIFGPVVSVTWCHMAAITATRLTWRYMAGIADRRTSRWH